MQDDALKMSSLARDQMKLVRDDIQTLLGVLNDDHKTQEIESGGVLAKLKETVDLLRTLVSDVPKTNRVLARLFFNSIFHREDHVVNPPENTFTWMTAWLSPSDKGSLSCESVAENEDQLAEVETTNSSNTDPLDVDSEGSSQDVTDRRARTSI